MKLTRDMMNATYGSVAVSQTTSKLLRWLFRHFNVSRNNFVSKFLQPGQALLDLGSGDGSFCAANRGKFNRVVGLDISSDRIQRAIEQYGNMQCQFLQHDFNDPLPFADHSFDVITSMAVVDWVYDLTGCLQEVYRVLQPNGRFVLEVNNLGYFVRRIKLLFGIYPNVSTFVQSAWPTIGWDASVCHYFTKKELVQFMTALGFKIERVTGSGLFYQVRNWWPSLLCGDLIFVCTKKK